MSCALLPLDFYIWDLLIVYVLAGGMDFDGNNFVYNIFDWNPRPLQTVGFSFEAIVTASVAHIVLWGGVAKGSEKIWSPNGCCHNKGEN